jgi:DNA-binding MarR family transcriptional regulator
VTVIPRNLPSPDVLAALAGRYPDVEPSAVQAMLTLLQVAHELSTLLERHFAQFELSRGRFTVLMLLRRDLRGLSPAELAEAAGVTRPTMTGLLRGLERSGLVVRRSHAEDHRSAVVSLAPKAHRLLDRVLPEHFRLQASLMGALGAAERAELLRLLTHVRPQPRAGGEP